jgi:hypothetical protein
LVPNCELLRQVVSGVTGRVGEVSHVVDGASGQVDIIIRGVGEFLWHFLFSFLLFLVNLFTLWLPKFKADLILFFVCNIMQLSILGRE